jgi:hypothetical protein
MCKNIKRKSLSDNLFQSDTLTEVALVLDTPGDKGVARENKIKPKQNETF